MGEIDWKLAAEEGGKGAGAFIGAFLFGSLMDIVFRLIYRGLAGRDPHHIFLFAMACVQLFFVAFLSALQQATDESTTLFFFTRMGFIVSQIFLLKYATSHLIWRDPLTKA